MSDAPETTLVTFRADLLRFSAFLTAPGSNYAPLAPPWLSGDLALTFLTADSAWPTRTLKREWRPTVAIIGDDLVYEAAVGPEGWTCTRGLARRTRFAVLHGTGGKPDHYREGATLARAQKRVELVETTSAKLSSWIEVFGRTPALIFRPPVQHPAPEKRGLQ